MDFRSLTVKDCFANPQCKAIIEQYAPQIMKYPIKRQQEDRPRGRGQDHREQNQRDPVNAKRKEPPRFQGTAGALLWRWEKRGLRGIDQRRPAARS